MGERVMNPATDLTIKDWSEYIKMLTQITRTKQVQWTAASSDRGSGYRTEFAGRQLWLRDVSFIAALDRAFGTSKPFGGVELQIVDDEGNPLFIFPDVPELKDLLAACKTQLAGLDSFFSALKEASGRAA